MRIALDLQACQTGSRSRGIGRYAMDLTREILSSGSKGHEILLGIDGTYEQAAVEVAQDVEGLVSAVALRRYYYPGPNRNHLDANDALRPAAEAMIRFHYARLAPELLHVHSLFEGFAEHAGGLGALANTPGVISSVTLYDLIPLIFPERYLANTEYRAWYLRKLDALRRFDVLLCISEATKRDAITRLGVSEDRVHVIGAGISPIFCMDGTSDAKLSGALKKWGIQGRYVLYTGNGDFRKNLPGALKAFAAVPEELRRGVQLVFNQVHDEPGLRQLAKRVGFPDRDLIITGHVSDTDLVTLLRNCELFFFPSLYEGFGLPVAEAMACGAPTICADNSSLPEVIGRRDAMFNAERPDQMAALLAKGLANEGFRKSLRESGLEQVKRFTWERSATLAMQAWDRALSASSTCKRRAIGKRRPRVAMVTPLPPEQTGIANYVSLLLGPLSRHWDIDLYTTMSVDSPDITNLFRVYLWHELEHNTARYDHVIYQFGNSPFHSHMVDLLDRLGGIVVLHDTFLSGMFSHMDGEEGRPGLFAQELERSHGRKALLSLSRDGLEAAKKAFPASRRIIERANAVVVHSRHSQELCERYYPYVGRGSWHTLPHVQPLAGVIEAVERAEIRRALGIAEDAFLIASFGFVADTKLNHVLLEALKDGRLREDQSIHVTFVGEQHGGDYGRSLERLIADLEMGDRIRITGYAPRDLYSSYLKVADCAVQLRTDSRGETSGAVLECLSHGIPTLISDHGSMSELRDDVVIKLPDDASPGDLAEQLLRIRNHAGVRTSLSQAARQYVAEELAPDRIAAMYANAVEDAAAWNRAADGTDLVEDLGIIFSERTHSEHELAAVEHSLENMHVRARPSRIFIDLSEVVATDYGTGIHRVVRNLARELMLLEVPTKAGYTCVAHDVSGVLRSEEVFVAELGLPVRSSPIDFLPGHGDVLLLLDSAWEHPERFSGSIEAVHGAGGTAGAFLHDLIPLRFPEYCVDYMPDVFGHWLKFVLHSCDFIICNSRATADDLAAWIKENSPELRARFRIGHIHLGSDLVEARATGEVTPSLRAAIDNGNAVLMVGTVEPRKGYDAALDAFEYLWAQGSDLRLVIAGKPGWNVDELVRRIRSHREWEQRLFWFQSLGDADLRHAYKHAKCLLQASIAEGFGLPVAEAARFRLPLVLSDIPVFHEIARDAASYFPVGDARALADQLSRSTLAPSSGAISITWREAARQLQQLLDGKGWDYSYR